MGFDGFPIEFCSGVKIQQDSESVRRLFFSNDKISGRPSATLEKFNFNYQKFWARKIREIFDASRFLYPYRVAHEQKKTVVYETLFHASALYLRGFSVFQIVATSRLRICKKNVANNYFGCFSFCHWIVIALTVLSLSLLILNKPTQCRGKLIFHNKFPATARLWACSSLEGLMWQFLIVPQKAIFVHYRHHSTEKEFSSSHNMHNM